MLGRGGKSLGGHRDAKMQTYKTGQGDRVRVGLAARGALDLEGVVKGRVFGVGWAEIGDAGQGVS